MATLRKAPAAGDIWPRKETVEHSDFGSLRLVLRKPTVEERAYDDGATFRAGMVQESNPTLASELEGTRRLRRILASVIGWEDVTDEDGAAVPFGLEPILNFLSQYPGAFRAFYAACLLAWQGIPAADLGNSGATPAPPPPAVANPTN